MDRNNARKFVFFPAAHVPHVLKHQKPTLHVKFANLSSPTGQLPSNGKEDFVNRLQSKLEFVVKEAPTEQVWNTSNTKVHTTEGTFLEYFTTCDSD